jgi:hypothetical protein
MIVDRAADVFDLCQSQAKSICKPIDQREFPGELYGPLFAGQGS